MGIRKRLREERAQATVEMAVVTPVLLVLALIVYNVMVFAGAVARFDRVVPDIVLAHAVAPSGEGDDSSIDASATVQAQIQHAMEGYDLQIEVSSEQGTATSDGGLLSLSGTFKTYTHHALRAVAELAQHRRRFAGGTGKVVARARSDGRSVASGGG